jgi:hypothetical protein
MTTPPLPTPPVIPTSITVTSAIAYLVAFALFVIGLLTFGGVTVPAHVSTEVQTWGAITETFAGAVTAAVTTVLHHNTVVTLLKR